MPAEPKHKRVGDLIWDRSMAHASYLNQSEFLTSLRTRALPIQRFVRHICAMYPVVVGFNRALIRSLSKLDNVRSAPLVRGLAEQLQEEQIHNDMWRSMLTSFAADHLALYSSLQEYFRPFSRETVDRMTRQVVDCLAQNREDVCPGYFPTPVFPEPVLALFHHMVMISSDDRYSFWCHFGSQSAMEATIYEIVSESYCPGTVGNPELDRGPGSTSWWREHSKCVANGDNRTTEEKHLEIAKITLNRSREANRDAEDVLRVVEESLLLFSATLVCHNAGQSPVLPKSA
jgi:hypothetical protein